MQLIAEIILVQRGQAATQKDRTAFDTKESKITELLIKDFANLRNNSSHRRLSDEKTRRS